MTQQNSQNEKKPSPWSGVVVMIAILVFVYKILELYTT